MEINIKLGGKKKKKKNKNKNREKRGDGNDSSSGDDSDDDNKQVVNNTTIINNNNGPPPHALSAGAYPSGGNAPPPQMMGGGGGGYPPQQQQQMGYPQQQMGYPQQQQQQQPMFQPQFQPQAMPAYVGGYQPPPQLQNINRLAPHASHTFTCDNIIVSVDEPSQRVNFDVGLICLDENLQCVESVFFSNKLSRDQSIQHMGGQPNPLTGTNEDCMSICFSRMDPRICYIGLCISDFNGFRLSNNLPMGCAIKAYASQPGQGLTAQCQPLFMSEVNNQWPTFVPGGPRVFDNCGSMLAIISCGGTNPNIYYAIAESTDGRICTANIDEMQRTIVSLTKGAITVNGVYMRQEALKQQQQQQMMMQQQQQAQQEQMKAAMGGAAAGAIAVGVGVAIASATEFVPTMPTMPKPSNLGPLTNNINRKISGEIVDSAGRVLMKAGSTTMDASGKILDSAGRVITNTGEILSKTGAKIGKLIPGDLMMDNAGRIINQAGDILDQAGRIIGKLLPNEIPDLLGDVAGAIAKAGMTVLKAVTGDTAQHILSTLGSIATNLPLIGAVGAAMKVFFDMAKQAKYNKLAADALNTRVTEVGLALTELCQTVKEPSMAMDAQLKTLTKVVTEAGEFLKQFAERSYLSRLFSGSSDDEAVKKFDKQLTDSVQSIQMSIGIQTIQLQQRTLNELDVMKGACSSKIGPPSADGSHLKKMSKEDVAELARALQIDEREFQDEMQVSMVTMLATQQRMEAQQNQIAKVLGVGDLDTMTSDRASKFWDEYFEAKEVDMDKFIVAFAETYNKGVEITPGEERKRVKKCLDTYPKDGKISYIEYKRFYKGIFADGSITFDPAFNVYEYIKDRA